jgi:hypothetical protein
MEDYSSNGKVLFVQALDKLGVELSSQSDKLG